MASRKITISLLALSLLLLLSACGGSSDEAGVSDADAVLTEAAAIANTSLAQTAAAAPPTQTEMPAGPTATETQAGPTLDIAASMTAALTGTAGTPGTVGSGGLSTSTSIPTATSSSSSGIPCLRASFEGETIYDNTHFLLEKEFTKTWKLKNTGSCTWTTDFNVFFVDGDIMDALPYVPISTEDISPGEYVYVEVDMISPREPGTYRGDWKLTSGNGEVFGVGPDGSGTLWVIIKAVEPNNP